MGNEDSLSLELQEALGGSRPKGWKPTTQYLQGSGLSSLLSGEGSCNIPKLRYATRLLREQERGKSVNPDTLNFWRTVFDTERREYMISEFGSTIYREWHFIPTLTVMRSKDDQVASEATEWCAYYLALSHLLEIDGQIYWPGQRSAGHAAIPGIHEWVYAMATAATGGDENVRRAEKWCKTAGIGLKRMWEYEAIQQLKPEMSKAWDLAQKYTIDDMKARGFRRPLCVYKTSEGLAAWIGPRLDDLEGWSCDNGNTPPVPSVIVANGEARWFPAGGGVRKQRVRQRFDHCRVLKVGNSLTYSSDIYGDDQAELPGGNVLLDIILGT